jgi:hypothetical protein
MHTSVELRSSSAPNIYDDVSVNSQHSTFIATICDNQQNLNRFDLLCTRQSDRHTLRKTIPPYIITAAIIRRRLSNQNEQTFVQSLISPRNIK